MKKILTLALLCCTACLAAQTDTLPPTVQCTNGLIIGPAPSGLVALWASDILQYTQDNVTPINQIQIAVRKKGSGTGFPVDSAGNPVTNIIYDCSELGNQVAELWARDLAGNAAKCEATLLVQDNQGNCAIGDYWLTICAKAMCSGLPVPNPTFRLYRAATPTTPILEISFLGDDNGCSEKALATPFPGTFELSAKKGEDPLSQNITTTDLVLLSKHINGEMPFTETWQWVAADADRNGKVEPADVVECRKIVLGLPHDIEPWRLFPETHVFPPGNPLSQYIPDSFGITAENLKWQMGPYNFLGVRVCDLTCDAVSPTVDPFSENSFVISPTPNPTAGGTTFRVFLAQPETLRLEVADLAGRVLYRSEAAQTAGDVVLELPADALPQAGVYVWRAVAGERVASGKILRE